MKNLIWVIMMVFVAGMLVFNAPVSHAGLDVGESIEKAEDEGIQTELETTDSDDDLVRASQHGGDGM